jgi:hypothetical protein
LVLAIILQLNSFRRTLGAMRPEFLEPMRITVEPGGRLGRFVARLDDRYLNSGKGIVAAEDVPPEGWILLARQYREHGVWPSTLGPPVGKPGSSCPREFAKEAS